MVRKPSYGPGSVADRETCRLADEYIELVHRGTNPEPEAFLARYPEYEQRLRPVIEGAAWLGSEFRRFKQTHPDFSLLDVLMGRARQD